MTNTTVTPTRRESAMALLGAHIVKLVAGYKHRARRFCYAVMLAGHTCPQCGGELTMVADGCCRCRSCTLEFDPTIAFQKCLTCGGQLRVRVRRYECSRCGAEIVSHFLFDGFVFDAAYFRQKMAEHRERKRRQHERVLSRLAETRSPALPPIPVDPSGTDGLWEALNGLAAAMLARIPHDARDQFDLRRYEAHVQTHTHTIAVSLDEIPPLSDSARLDRIWRFVAIIFLAHAGQVTVWQENDTIWVMEPETHREGQAVPGELESVDGVEGPVGRAEA